MDLNTQDFINSFPEFDSSIFCVVCSDNETDKIKFLIEKDFGLNYIAQDRSTGFIWLCKHNNYECLQILLDKNILPKSFYYIRNIYGWNGLDYLRGNEKKNIIKQISEMNNTDDEFHSDFRVYKLDEFVRIKYNEKIEGFYGEIIHVKHKETGRDMIIKKYKDTDVESDTIKEISYLKYINKLNPHIAVILYGVIFANNSIYLVEEYLTHTLLKEIQYLGLNDTDELEKIIRKTLVVLNELNGIGISHNDIKLDNLMFDLDGRLKFIDFGVSDYLGLYPIDKVVKNVIINELRRPPETREFLVLIPKNESENIYLKPDPIRTLNLDIFTVGIMFLSFLSKPYSKLFYNNKLYGSENEGMLNEIDINESNLFKFLYQMIEYDREKRIYPRDALTLIGTQELHKEDKEDKEDKEQKLHEEQEETVRNIFEFKNIPYFKNHTNYKNSMDRELYYKTEIYNSLLFCKFQNPSSLDSKYELSGKKFNNFLILSNWLLQTTYIYELPIDTYLNAINLYKCIISTSNKINSDMYEIIGLCCLYLYSCIFLGDERYDLLKEIVEKHSEKKFRIVFYRILTNYYSNEYDSFTIVPISSQIGYVICKMQEYDIEPKNIGDVHKKLLKYAVLYVNFNGENELFTWNIVRYSYYCINQEFYNNELPELGIMDDLNFEECNKINDIVHSKNDNFRAVNSLEFKLF